MHEKVSAPLKGIGCTLLSLLLAGEALAAEATLIDFDDLPATGTACEEDRCEPTPVSDQYQSLGLRVEGGGITTREKFGDGILSGAQALSDWRGPGLTLKFSGSPRYVSMYISALFGQSVHVDARGEGFQEEVTTEGWHGTEAASSEYAPRQRVSFHSPAGIDEIRINGFYGLDGGVVAIDNLSFGTAPAVSESVASRGPSD